MILLFHKYSKNLSKVSFFFYFKPFPQKYETTVFNTDKTFEHQINTQMVSEGLCESEDLLIITLLGNKFQNILQ